jgi:hypothetical protein
MRLPWGAVAIQPLFCFLIFAFAFLTPSTFKWVKRDSNREVHNKKGDKKVSLDVQIFISC